MKVQCEKWIMRLQPFSCVVKILTRITVGWVFLEAGWGKWKHLPKVVEFFQELQIPLAHIQAPFVAGVEVICGALLLLGLFTRLASIPLVFVMLVALLTAKREEIGSFSDLFGVADYLYIVLLLWLIVEGAGRGSLDHFIKQKCS